jgi:Fe-S-cluster containining protein
MSESTPDEESAMADEALSDDMATGNVELAGPGWRLVAQLTAPRGPSDRRRLLPMARSLSDAAADLAIRGAESVGRPVSCRAGCAACCRQMVLISETEARQLHDLVEALPEPRRSEIRARFAAALQRLEQADLRGALDAPESYQPGMSELGLAYFRLRIDCPFLEDERCTIYEDRPLACREYLVLSPAEHCSKPDMETVKQLRLPFKVTQAFALLEDAPLAERQLRRVPLVLALEWETAHPDDAPPLAGTKWAQMLLENVTGKEWAEASEPEV